MIIELSMMCSPWGHMPTEGHFSLVVSACLPIIAFPYSVSAQTGSYCLLQVRENSTSSLKELSLQSFGPF